MILLFNKIMFSLSVFACLGFLSPANRGALMTCALVSCLKFIHTRLIFFLQQNIKSGPKGDVKHF